MTSFHTEVCSTATVWFCLTPSFSLYNRESERNRSRRPGRGGVVCVVLCDRSRTGRREREGSGFADADSCVCVCRCESPGTACSSSAFPSSSSCSSSFCCRVSWWHTSNAWPTVRTILMAWDCERGWDGDSKKMVCVCVDVLREQQQEANEGGCTNESTQSGRKWGPRGVAQEEKRIQRERVYEHCAQVTREKMKNASRRRKGNVGAKQEVKADGNGGRRKKTN